MFAWICPTCGRECQPSQTECPRCSEKERSEKEPAEKEKAKPPATESAALAAAIADPAPAPPVYALPPRRSGIPTWLMSIVFTLAFGGLLTGGYFGYQHYKNGKESPASPAVEAPRSEAKTAAGAAPANPLLKQIEVSGLRITQGKNKKPQIRFLVVNHSLADIGDLGGSLRLMAKDEAVGSCDFKVTGLGPYESKEVDIPLVTKMQAYELPDWQFLRAEFSLKTP